MARDDHVLLIDQDVPVVVARGWTEQQKGAYRPADNEIPAHAMWDKALLRVELTLHPHSLIEALISAICEGRWRRALRASGISAATVRRSMVSAGHQGGGVSDLFVLTA